MPEIVADRFIAAGASWIDLATGTPVRLRVSPAGSTAQQVDWSAQCAILANLRHPLLNSLVDFGALDRTRTFEAYECREPLAASGSGAERLLTHATRFVEAHGLILEPLQASCAIRSITAGPSVSGRPVGVTLQPRSALRVIADALEDPSPPGPCTLVVTGASGAGLRTLRLMVARAARLAGYVPLAAPLPRTYPWLATELAGRHVCVLQGEGRDSRDAAALVAALACGSARRHAVVSFVRSEDDSPGSVRLEPLGVTTMTRMIFLDAEHGPEPADLLAAVRRAGGVPGALIAELGGVPLALPSRIMQVRETAPAYIVFPEAASVRHRSGERRTAAVLFRAATRARALAARGRHAAAMRLLARAARVLHARGDHAESARCEVRLGEVKLARGKTADALASFARAMVNTTDECVRAEAALGMALVRIAEGRPGDAEAALRGALVASGGATATRAASTLARVLLLQDRRDEAAAVLHALPIAEQDRPEAAAVRAELHLADGNLATAVQTSLAAAERARSGGDHAVIAEAERVCALALRDSGDRKAALDHARDALASARRAHLPLECARLRELIASLAAATASVEMTQPLRTSSDLPALLDLAHGAADERQAISLVCEEVRSRLRSATVLVIVNASDNRVIAATGRAWCGEPVVAHRAMSAAAGVIAGTREPAEAAEPIKLAGEVIGAFASRWAAGTAVQPDRASALLRAAALVVAPFVRDLAQPVVAEPTAESHGLLGESPAAASLRQAVARAARAPFPALIEGESGSGKELVARGIHRLSVRRDRRFCTLNCAALTDDLVEAELFGHARGAFTGAVGERAGLFEEADGGTVFLDEVGELSPRAQAKLLRVLQDGEVRRVGENVPRHVDVRIVAATNRSLEREVAAGRFRPDLRFRLDVIRIDVPPLRERATDIPMLAAHFWAEAAPRVGSRATLSPEALGALARYDWPGNVRELQNVIAWMAVHSPRRGRIGSAALPAHVAQATVPTAVTFDTAREEFERRFIRAALAAANGRRARAAEALGVTRQGLAKMMKRLGLEA